MFLIFCCAAASERREIGRRGDASGTGPHHRDIVASGYLASDVDSFIKRCDIGIESPFAMRRGGIAPADAEHLNAAVEQEADHAFVRRQIQCVIFVDLRRRNDQRPLSHIRRRRRILYQLQQFVAEDHSARRGRERLANLEGGSIHHRRHAAVFREIIEIVLQSRPQASAAGIDEFAHRRRVGQHCIGRSYGIDQDFRHQMRPCLVDLAQARFVDQTADGIAPGEIGLEQSTVNRALLPAGVGEAPVTYLRCTFRLAGGDSAEFTEKGEPQLGGNFRFVDDGLEQKAGTIDQILSPDPNQRIER